MCGRSSWGDGIQRLCQDLFINCGVLVDPKGHQFRCVSAVAKSGMALLGLYTSKWGLFRCSRDMVCQAFCRNNGLMTETLSTSRQVSDHLLFSVHDRPAPQLSQILDHRFDAAGFTLDPPLTRIFFRQTTPPDNTPTVTEELK